jgi:hypothetical protein
MREFFQEFWRAARQGPQLYFAPLRGAVRGAIRGVRLQWRLMNRLG